MKKKIILVLIVVAVIAVIVIARSGKKKPGYQTIAAAIGTVRQTVDVTGQIKSSEAIELNFKTAGRVAAIPVKIGQNVSRGQLLASLDAGALSSGVADAESALLEARANLEKTIAGSTPEDIRISEIVVNQKEQELSAAKANLENLKIKRDTELFNLKKTAVVTLNNELLDAKAALETIKNTLNNTDADKTLGILNSSLVARAEQSRLKASQTVAQTQTAIAGIDENSSAALVESALQEVEKALSDTRSALSDTFLVLENTITSSDLTQSELGALLAGIQSEQVTIATSKTNLLTAESNWTNNQVYYLDLARQYEDKVAAAQDSLELARAQLELKKAGPKNYDINIAQAKIAKAEATLRLAQANYGDAVIKAPLDGTLIEIAYRPGEQTALSQPVIKMIGRSELQIEVDIPESDIAKITVGQAAEITLDSFGDDQVFQGSVIFIDPGETIIQDVVYYQVKVQFSEARSKIKPGMTANVTIMTALADDVLRVPLRAVKQKNGDKIVEVLTDDGQVKEKIIALGLKGDDYYEIKSGLNEGERVITFVKNGQ